MIAVNLAILFVPLKFAELHNHSLSMTTESKGPRTKMLLVYVGAIDSSDQPKYWPLSCRCPVKVFHFYVLSALQFIVSL